MVVLALKGPGAQGAGYHMTLSLIGDVADDMIMVPKVDPFLEPILASVRLQVLTYHVADLGTDADQPRNLAKSITVE